jgi:hypothetical protein
MKYRKKPVVIEAVQFKRSNSTEIINFTENKASIHIPRCIDGVAKCFIDTLEGKMTAIENDYIIKGVHGEFYPCKPDIFDETYDAVN